MGRTFLRGTYRNLCCWNPESHFARLSDQLRNNGMVAAKMVKTGGT
jgi:hypothetical protein